MKPPSLTISAPRRRRRISYRTLPRRRSGRSCLPPMVSAPQRLRHVARALRPGCQHTVSPRPEVYAAPSFPSTEHCDSPSGALLAIAQISGDGLRLPMTTPRRPRTLTWLPPHTSEPPPATAPRPIAESSAGTPGAAASPAHIPRRLPHAPTTRPAHSACGVRAAVWLCVCRFGPWQRPTRASQAALRVRARMCVCI